MKIKFVVIYYSKKDNERFEMRDYNDYESAVNHIKNSPFLGDGNYYVIEKRFCGVKYE